MVTRTQAGIGIGSALAFIITVGGAWSVVKPFAQSDDPPLIGLTRFNAEVSSVQELAANVAAQQKRLDAADVTQAFLAQGFYQNQIVQATIALRKNPNDAGQLQLKLNAEQQLIRINSYLAAHTAHY